MTLFLYNINTVKSLILFKNNNCYYKDSVITSTCLILFWLFSFSCSFHCIILELMLQKQNIQTHKANKDVFISDT